MKQLASSIGIWPLLVMSSQLSAQSLDEVLQKFLQSSPYVLQQQYKRDEAEQVAKEARAALLPSLGISSELRQDPEKKWLATEGSAEQHALVLSQPIFGGTENYYTWQASTRGKDQVVAEVEGGLQSLKFEMIAAYIAVLAQQEILQGQTEQVTILQEQKSVVKARFEAGSAILSDLRQAEARLAASEGRRALALSQLEQALSNFTRLSGIAPPLQLTWPSLPDSLPADSQSLYAGAIAANPSLRAASFAIERQEALKDANDMLFLPEVDASYRIAQSRELGSAAAQYRDEVIIGLNLNLFAGLRTYHANARLATAVERSRQEREMVKRQLQRESEAVISSYRAASSNLRSLELAVSSSQEATRAFQLEYQNGTRSLSDLLGAEQELLQSKVALIEAKSTYFLSSYRIQYVLGTL